MAATPPLTATALVFAGGGTGAVLRYNLGRAMTRWLGEPVVSAFPWGTLVANVIGSLAMGLLVGFLARHGSAGSEGWRLFAAVGLLGGFTTFSSFSLEMGLLIERGAPGLAVTYAAVSLAAGLAGLFLGLTAMRLAA